MEDINVITNNPLIKEKYSGCIPIEYQEVGYLKLLEIVRNKIHSGSKLLTHPLSSSVKPNETPYKTIAIANENDLDMDSLLMIEQSIETAKKFLKDDQNPKFSEETLKDCQVIDLSIVASVLDNLL
ncbi:MAG TPA: GrdX family protein [Tissierellales bacterium]|nr:GrdX family protein [Tissierellales bacterium]